jgi:hypothetical protein
LLNVGHYIEVSLCYLFTVLSDFEKGTMLMIQHQRLVTRQQLKASLLLLFILLLRSATIEAASAETPKLLRAALTSLPFWIQREEEQFRGLEHDVIQTIASDMGYNFKWTRPQATEI